MLKCIINNDKSASGNSSNPESIGVFYTTALLKTSVYPTQRKFFSFDFLQVKSAVDATQKDKPTRPCSGETNLKVVVTMMNFICTVHLHDIIAENFMQQLAESMF